MKILITGDKGFVGTETKKLLSLKDHEVIGFDLMDCYDIRDKGQLRDFITFHKPDRILHLAAIARFTDADKDPRLAFETNVLGTKNISDLASEAHIPVVYASTGSVYMPIKQSPPITEDFPAFGNSVYGCSKYVGELYIKSGRSPYIILRYAHLYGKEKRMHGLIGGFLDRIERGLAPTLYGGKQSNDFTYIKDIAEANLSALLAPWDKWNQIYNIGTGEELSAEKAGEVICRHMKYAGKIEIEKGREVDAERFVYDIKKAKTMLGFIPKWSFEKGIEDMLTDYDESLHPHFGKVGHDSVL